MSRALMLAGLAAVALWTSSALGGEKIKLPTGPTKAKAQVTTAIQRTAAPITNVAWPARAMRNGWYPGGGYYAPFYSYRPYYNYDYVTPSYGYYTAPYYGYSYYAPGTYYYGGPRVAVGPLGVGRAVWW